LKRNNNAETLKKVKIKNNTEKIGFFVQTTNIDDTKLKAEKITKRLHLINI
jgi:hypothetical protein